MRKIILKIRNTILLFVAIFLMMIIIAKITGLSTSQIKPMSWSEIFGGGMFKILGISIGIIFVYICSEYYDYRKKKKKE